MSLVWEVEGRGSEMVVSSTYLCKMGPTAKSSIRIINERGPSQEILAVCLQNQAIVSLCLVLTEWVPDDWSCNVQKLHQLPWSVLFAVTVEVWSVHRAKSTRWSRSSGSHGALLLPWQFAVAGSQGRHAERTIQEDRRHQNFNACRRSLRECT